MRNAGVTGVGNSVRYMFVILVPTKVVLAVLGVTGSKPFHTWPAGIVLLVVGDGVSMRGEVIVL